MMQAHPDLSRAEIVDSFIVQMAPMETGMTRDLKLPDSVDGQVLNAEGDGYEPEYTAANLADSAKAARLCFEQVAERTLGSYVRAGYLKQGVKHLEDIQRLLEKLRSEIAEAHCR